MMTLDKKKALASRTLGVGKNKIWFDPNSLSDIKEVITKQDIRDLYEAGVIKIKDPKGRRVKVKRKTKKRTGKIKKIIARRKKHYVRLVRKLRRHLRELKKQGRLKDKEYWDLRRKIKANSFKDKSHLVEYLGGINKK